MQASLKGGRTKHKRTKKTTPKTIIKEEGKKKKNSSPRTRSSQIVPPQQPPMQKALWWLCRDQRTLGARAAGPASPRIMESLLIFLIYSVITDMCRRCVCVRLYACVLAANVPANEFRIWPFVPTHSHPSDLYVISKRSVCNENTDRCTFSLSDASTVFCSDTTFDLCLHEKYEMEQVK